MKRALVPAGLAATGLLIAFTLLLGWPRATVMQIAPLAIVVGLSALERTRPRWRDAAFFGVSALIGGLAPLAVAAMLSGHVGPALALPFWAALPLALVGLDLVGYAVHRAFHASPLLWRLHAWHHAPVRLYALVAMVDHPLFTLVIRSARAALAVLVGFSVDVAFAIALLDAWQGFSAHLGVDTRNRWLARFVVTPDAHRMHHSADPAHAGNYALTLTLWDHVFGTYVAPSAEAPVLGIGPRRPY